MLMSMTGYGNAKGHVDGKEIVVELKCLNSKINDFRIKMPTSYRQKELELRKILNDTVIRGKLDVTILVDQIGDQEDFVINDKLFKTYGHQIKALGTDLNLDNADILNAILKFPNVIVSQDSLISETEYQYTLSILHEAIEKLNDFRSIEGAIASKDMALRLSLITEYLKKIEAHEEERMKTVKDKLNKAFTQAQNEHIDKNRFEQELIYYLERIDFTEEKVRLKQHCDYFIEELSQNEFSKSKKLNFISQEIGREINTLGAKAQHAMIQKYVVLMKDELEKIKEQLNNVL
ncbi:MAG TPA: DUF1732 domain-containing protein [Saprospiraceae bacterium]|nr:DUF1732 domain-containing protein [Saprospiraceae bacterium]